MVSWEDTRKSTAATPRASRVMELEKLRQVSGHEGQDVALFNLKNLLRLVNDLIKQKITSLSPFL